METDSDSTPSEGYVSGTWEQKGEHGPAGCFRCPACGTVFAPRDASWRCRCGAPLDWVGREPSFSLEALRHRPPDLWRYAEALPPVPPGARVTLGEGMTPLVEERWQGAPLLLKLDHLMPTGSFKDRGAAVMISLLKAWGIDEVVEDSSGNAAASVAAYAARAGMGCRILVPQTASPAKLVQAQAAGAQVVRIPGDRQATALAAQEEAGRRYYASHVWNPLFLEGTQTAAFEIWEQMGGAAPRAVVVPVGNGSLLLGLARGFRALSRAGMIDRIPLLVGVQARACAPLATAFARGSAEPLPPEPGGASVAEGIAVARPARGAQILQEVRASGGTMLAVEDEAVWQAARWLARRGWFVEPTGAVALAGLARWREEGRGASSDGPVVVMVTGSGLKQASLWQERLGG